MPLESLCNLHYRGFNLQVEFTNKYASQANITLHYLQKMTGPGTVLHPIVEDLRKAVLEGGSWTTGTNWQLSLPNTGN